MIKLGKVYKNLMVDLKPKNRKLVERAKRIIMLGTGVSMKKPKRYFEISKRNKLAIVMIETKSDFDRAQKLLEEAGGLYQRL